MNPSTPSASPAPRIWAVALLLAACGRPPDGVEDRGGRETAGPVDDTSTRPIDDTATTPDEHVLVDAAGVRRIILVTLDTLRADRIEPGRMPFLTGLQNEGVVWTSAWGQTWTYASVGTITTGRNPATWGVDSYLGGGDTPSTLGPDVPTLADGVGSLGWASAYWASNLVGIATNLHRGYDVTETMGVGVTGWHDDLLAWVAANEGQNQLLHVHMNDVHDPYNVWADSCATAQGELPLSECRYDLVEVSDTDTEAAAQDMMGGSFTQSSEDFETCRSVATSLYDCEVIALDEALRALFDRLSAGGYLDDALVVISPDHGEGLFDPYPNHGFDQRAPITRNRVIFWAPGRLAPEVVTTPLGQDDILPTMEALLELSFGLEYTGQPYWEVAADRVVTGYNFARSSNGTVVESHYAVNDRYHYIRASTGAEQLYDHVADPGEFGSLIGVVEIPPALAEAVEAQRGETAGYGAE